MDKIFLTVLNMSLTGAFVILAICIARLPLKKAPKIISYCLWVVAWFRLMVPFSIESVISLIPFNTSPIPTDIAFLTVPVISTGIPVVNNLAGNILPVAGQAESVNSILIWTTASFIIWLCGIAAMLLYGIISYSRLAYKMKSAKFIEDNIYEIHSIKSPFVLGIISPKIYLPLSLNEEEREYIILHEKTHIQRKDHIVKLAAYLVLCVHWFNPLAWIAFILMGADMEMSCDESVLKKLGTETKKNYSMSLLSLAESNRFLSGSPLSFSEGGLKARINNVLKYKKTTPLLFSVVAITLTAALGVGLVLNKSNTSDKTDDVYTVDLDKVKIITEKINLADLDRIYIPDINDLDKNCISDMHISLDIVSDTVIFPNDNNVVKYPWISENGDIRYVEVELKKLEEIVKRRISAEEFERLSNGGTVGFPWNDNGELQNNDETKQVIKDLKLVEHESRALLLKNILMATLIEVEHLSDIYIDIVTQESFPSYEPSVFILLHLTENIVLSDEQLSQIVETVNKLYPEIRNESMWISDTNDYEYTKPYLSDND